MSARASPLGFNAHAPKRATNLSLNSDLLQRARSLGINLSATLEAELARLVREEESRRKQAEIDRAVAQSNEFHRKYGSPIDEYLEDYLPEPE